MQVGVFRHVQQPYKKVFKQHRDKLYKTVQTKQIRLEAKTYVMVGQMRLQQSPLVSHFDVFDDIGQSADERVGRKTHDFVSILLLSKSFRDVKAQLHEFSQYDVQAEDVKQEFTPVREEDRIHLTKLLEEQMATLDEFLAHVDHVLAKECWDDSDIMQIEQLWATFWKVYEERATTLFALYEKNTFSDRPSNEKEGWITALEEEAKIVHQVQMALAPMYTEKVGHTLQELISLNYHFGRMKQQDAPIEKDNKIGRVSYVFMNSFYRVYLLVFLPLIIFGSSSTDGDSPSYFRLFTFLGLLLVIRGQAKSRLIAKNNTYLVELRGDQLTDISAEQHEEETKASTFIPIPQSQKKKPILYDTTVLSIDIIGIFIFITIFLFAMTISILVKYDFEIDIVMKYLFLIDILVLAFTLWVPYSPLARRRFIVTNKAVQLRKEKIGVLEIKHIVFKGEGKNVNLFVTFHSSPYKLRVPEDDREPLKAALKAWCTSNRVPFKDKDAEI